jgi:hypothetical protein
MSPNVFMSPILNKSCGHYIFVKLDFMLKKLCFTLHKEHYSRAGPIWPDYIDETLGKELGIKTEKQWRTTWGRHENPWQQIGY